MFIKNHQLIECCGNPLKTNNKKLLSSKLLKIFGFKYFLEFFIQVFSEK